MFNSREFGIHLMTLVLVICTPIYVIPNLSTNLSNYIKDEGVLKDTRIDEREYTGKFFQKRVERTLILNLENGKEIRLSRQYSKYWKELQYKESIGKIITYYLANNTTWGSNPVQIELESKVIYNPSQNRMWAYLLVFMTVGCMIYSGKKLYEFVTLK